jgi:hypothetical protein
MMPIKISLGKHAQKKEGKQTIQGEQMFKAANGGWYRSTKAVV